MDLFIQYNGINILIFIILIIISISISEIIKYGDHKQEFMRKIPHILIGVIFSITPYFMNKYEIIIFSLFLLLGIFISKYLKIFKSIFSLKRITIGMGMMPLSLTFLSGIGLPNHLIPFLVGIFTITFSDSLAAIIGTYFGKKKILGFQKTFIGSFSFFLITGIIFGFFNNKANLFTISIISAILTLIEIILIFGLDNIFIPLISSYLFYIFCY